MGVTVMDYDRFVKFVCHAQESAKDLFLVCAGRAVAIEIQADLADGDYFGAGKRKFTYYFVAGIIDTSCIVGMDTDGCVELGIFFSQLYGFPAGFDVGTYYQYRSYPGISGSLQHLFKVAGIITIIDMGV
jgi:hypothetical protein